jgi:hypothetical protein
MNFDSISLSPLFEKSLLRITADFGSSKTPGSVASELSKELKRRVSTDLPGDYNLQLIKSEDGKFQLTTAFLLYRDARLLIISLLKWIERNGLTDKSHNFIVDLKFSDATEGPFKGTLFNTATKIENIDKLKFILEFDEAKVYDVFPSRKNWYSCQSIQRFDPIQKFAPKQNQEVDPRFYNVDAGSTCGVNFEKLMDGFLRMQYIGGTRYNEKVTEILEIINEFCVTAWNCTVNKGFTKDNITKFEKLLQRSNQIRESYLDYALFKKNFPKIKFTVDLIDNQRVLETYYNIIRDRIYDLLINIEFEKEFDLNYDTNFCVLQIRDAELKIQKIVKVDFVNCKISFGIIEKCDFYDCEITDAVLSECNLFRYTKADRCRLFNSVCNRTTELNQTDVEGLNGVMNGKMKGGTFFNGKVGLFGDISKETKVIEYQKIKSGYFVAGDQIIIPSKKFNVE